MSGPAYRYELWGNGQLLGKYKTLGQALLGATWRSRKRAHQVGIYRQDPMRVSSRCLAIVTGY